MAKNKALIGVVALHLLGCVFFSFDWAFLHGEYLGFGLTFLFLYAGSAPILVASIALAQGVYAVLKKRATLSKLICGGIGVVILLLYVLSACGVLSGSPLLSVAYVAPAVGTLGILCVWLCCLIQKRNTKKAR